MFKKATPVAICLDFDGTITEVDVVDGILIHYADELEWMAYETEWNEGRIGSDVCLAKQLALVKIKRDELKDYLKTIRIDSGYKALRLACDAHKIPMAILSDGFDLFIKEIFRINQLAPVTFKANHLSMKKSTLIPDFPHKDASCHRCANCKRKFLIEQRKNVGHLIFVGDGGSDICAVKDADTVFAKGALRDHCERMETPFIRYENLRDVALALPNVLKKIKSQQETLLEDTTLNALRPSLESL